VPPAVPSSLGGDAHGRFRAGALIPLQLDATGTPLLDARRESVARIRALSREDFGNKATRLSASGRLAPLPATSLLQPPSRPARPLATGRDRF
jgi:hypothetical protein